MKIKHIQAREILDSRGYPTIETQVILESGKIGRVEFKDKAAVPSGASTGAFEAIELRDGGERFNGKGVLLAIENVNKIIAPALIGREATNQAEIDNIMRDLDGTSNKSKLGANAILSVSLAICKASARSENLELYKYMSGLYGGNKLTMPRPMMNILNGGVHADNKLDIQEFMIVPAKHKAESPNQIQSMKGFIELCFDVYQALKKILKSKGLSINVGDEGGFAPQLDNTKQALNLICEAIDQTKYKLGTDVQLALDVAASELSTPLESATTNTYAYSIDGVQRDSNDMVVFYKELLNQYPIISIEDPLAEEDWNGFTNMTAVLGNSLQIVGDDLFVTNAKRLNKGIRQHAANAVLIKPNQIGTLTETFKTIKLAQDNNYNVIVSHRSGETMDASIADLSVAVNAQFIKTGAPARGERVIKYNRLLEIECNECDLLPIG